MVIKLEISNPNLVTIDALLQNMILYYKINLFIIIYYYY